jgi:hypothetical protein
VKGPGVVANGQTALEKDGLQGFQVPETAVFKIFDLDVALHLSRAEDKAGLQPLSVEPFCQFDVLPQGPAAQGMPGTGKEKDSGFPGLESGAAEQMPPVGNPVGAGRNAGLFKPLGIEFPGRNILIRTDTGQKEQPWKLKLSGRLLQSKPDNNGVFEPFRPRLGTGYRFRGPPKVRGAGLVTQGGGPDVPVGASGPEKVGLGQASGQGAEAWPGLEKVAQSPSVDHKDVFSPFQGR